MTDATEAAIARAAKGYGTFFAILFWMAVLWLFAEFYVPLKQWGASWSSGDPAAFEEGLRRVLRLLSRMLPALALLAALRSAERLFRRLSEGAILTAEAGRSVEGIGTWVLVAGVLGLVGLDGGAADVAVHFRPDLVLAAVGLALRFVGRVWVMAAGIKAEHDQIV